MTDRPARATRRSVGMITTAIVAFGAAATVGWAAAVPVIGSGSPAGSASSGVSSTSAAQQVDAAQANLQQVRRDLARMLSSEDDMPRAKLANVSALLAQLPSVQVPQSSSPVITHVTAPVTHTTTGASGARP